MTTIEQNGLRRQPTGALIKKLSEQAGVLVRQEIELAKVELAEKGRSLGPGVAALGGAAIAGVFALGSLTAFLVLALDGVMPAWLAALCVALLWAVVGSALWFYGRDRLEAAGKPLPEKTIETVKEDVEWLKHPTS